MSHLGFPISTRVMFLCASQESRREFYRLNGRAMTTGQDELHRHVAQCPYHPKRQQGVRGPHSYYVREPELLKQSLRELAARKLADMLRKMTSQEFERFSGECALGHPAQRCSSVTLARNALLPYLALLTNRPSHCRTTAFWSGENGARNLTTGGNVIAGKFGGDGTGDVQFIDSGITAENARRVAASSRAGSPEMPDVDIGLLPDAIASLAEDAPAAAVALRLEMPYLQVFRDLHAQARELRLHATAKTVAAALFSCEWNPVEAMAILAPPEPPAPPDQAAAAAAAAAELAAARDVLGVLVPLSRELQDLPSDADVDLLARTCADYMARPDQVAERRLGFSDVRTRLQSLVEMGWCISLAMSDPVIC